MQHAFDGWYCRSYQFFRQNNSMRIGSHSKESSNTVKGCTSGLQVAAVERHYQNYQHIPHKEIRPESHPLDRSGMLVHDPEIISHRGELAHVFAYVSPGGESFLVPHLGRGVHSGSASPALACARKDPGPPRWRNILVEQPDFSQSAAHFSNTPQPVAQSISLAVSYRPPSF